MNSLESLETPNVLVDAIALRQKLLKPSHLQDYFPTNCYERGFIDIDRHVFAYALIFFQDLVF
jgi:hypothetical protein